jgi:hypothetical protein
LQTVIEYYRARAVQLIFTSLDLFSVSQLNIFPADSNSSKRHLKMKFQASEDIFRRLEYPAVIRS